MRSLLVTPASPFAPDSGAAQRTALLHAALARLGAVDVLLLTPGADTRMLPVPDERIALRAAWKSLPLGAEGYARHEALTRLVAGTLDLAAYDLVVGRYLMPVSKLALPPPTPALVDLDDVCTRFDSSVGWGGHALAARTRAWLKQSAVASVLPRFRGCFFVSPLDRERFAGVTGTVLPNIPYDPPDAPDAAAPGETVLFVGSLWYAPNRAGVERFLARTWPQVRAARPGARLVLVGAAPAAQRDRWAAHPGVSAPGYVDDLGAAYRGAALAVAPVWSGGGTNIKVLEALAHARACVTTRFCARAFGDAFDPASDLAVADDDDGLARAVIRLLADRREREARARRGAAVVARRFGRKHFDAAVRDLVARVTPAAVAA
jgi:glycosyltransferase involved in cell wall biosynthesis